MQYPAGLLSPKGRGRIVLGGDGLEKHAFLRNEPDSFSMVFVYIIRFDNDLRRMLFKIESGSFSEIWSVDAKARILQWRG